MPRGTGGVEFAVDRRALRSATRAWRSSVSHDDGPVARDDKSWEQEAYANTGPPALQAALTARCGGEAAARLFVRRVPVPPTSERPLERRPGGVWVAGARSGSLAALIDAAVLLGRLIELEPPPIILTHHRLVVQHALHAVLAAWGCGEAPAPSLALELPEAGAGPSERTGWSLPGTHADLASPSGVAFVDARRAVLATATATFEVDLATGAVLRWWPSVGLSLATCLEGYVVYYAGWGVACFELARARWTRGALPACLPFVFEELQEQSFVIETVTRRRHRLHAVADYPVELRVTPCARYLAVRDKHGGGGVYRCDGELQLPLELASSRAPVMWPEGQLRAPTQAEADQLADDAWCGEQVHALVLCEARDAWRRVQDGGLVEDTRVLFRLPLAIAAAAFDRGGGEVLVADERQLWHLALDPEPRLLARFDLQPLHAMLLGPAGRSRPRPDALNAVLCRYGSLLGIGDVELDELAQLDTASAFDNPRLLGKARARRLVAHAQGARKPRKLPRLWPPK